MLKDTPITPPDELTKHKSSDFRRAFWQLVAMFAEQLVWGLLIAATYRASAASLRLGGHTNGGLRRLPAP
jgi:hypothetical protein